MKSSLARPQLAAAGACVSLVAIWKQMARPSLAGGVFPVEPGEDERDAYADAMQTGQEWLDEGGTVVSLLDIDILTHPNHEVGV
jgi:hypothetical protein